jgi:hypothetical protein
MRERIRRQCKFFAVRVLPGIGTVATQTAIFLKRVVATTRNCGPADAGDRPRSRPDCPVPEWSMFVGSDLSCCVDIVMTWKQHVLVVANLTAGSQALLNLLRDRAERAPTAIHLIVPASPLGDGRDTAVQNLEGALAQLRDEGLEADGVLGHPDPFIAVIDVWDPRRHDEIIVSTLPLGASKWLHAGLPERIERATGALVEHVVSPPPARTHATRLAPTHEDLGVLTPLSVLGWSHRK